MSKIVNNVPALVDDVTGALVGFMGKDGKEARLPAIVSGALVDPITNAALASGSTASGLVASALVAAYEAQARDNEARGHILEPRAGLTADNTPIISASSTAPGSDADVMLQKIRVLGADVSGGQFASLAQRVASKKWMRGNSVGAPILSRFTSAYRAASIVSSYGTAGNASLWPEDGYGYNQGITYEDFFLSGDVFAFQVEGGSKFLLWVDGNLIQGAGSVGAGITCDTGVTDQWTPGGNFTVKVKFPTSKRRRIKLATHTNGSFGDLWTRETSTIVPACDAPITWVHMGDSFSEYTGATLGIHRSLSEYMSSAFGPDIDFINTARGGAGLTVGNDVGGTTASVPSKIRANFVMNGSKNNPNIITALLGKNDDGANQSLVVAEAKLLFAKMREMCPNAIPIIFATATGVQSMSAGLDLAVEASIGEAAAATDGGSGYIIFVPLQSGPNGPFLRGQGSVIAPHAGALTLASNITASSTGTLSTNWTGTTGTHSVTFTTAVTTASPLGFTSRRCTLTNGATSMAILNGNVTTTSTVCPSKRGNSDLYTGIGPSDDLHPSPLGHKETGLFLAQRLVEAFRKWAQ